MAHCCSLCLSQTKVAFDRNGLNQFRKNNKADFIVGRPQMYCRGNQLLCYSHRCATRVQHNLLSPLSPKCVIGFLLTRCNVENELQTASHKLDLFRFMEFRM